MATRTSVSADLASVILDLRPDNTSWSFSDTENLCSWACGMGLGLGLWDYRIRVIGYRVRRIDRG